jgi:hypothetical protein
VCCILWEETSLIATWFIKLYFLCARSFSLQSNPEYVKLHISRIVKLKARFSYSVLEDVGWIYIDISDFAMSPIRKNDSSHKSNDFDYNSIQFNSIQFSSYLFVCQLNSPKANYWVSTNKEKNKIHKQNIKTYNLYYLNYNHNNSINTNQGYHCEVKK